MDLKKLVANEVQKNISQAEISSEHKQACLNSERKHIFINHLTEQLKGARSIILKRGSKLPSEKNYKWAIAEMTNLYIANVEAYADAKKVSEAEKSRIKSETDKLKDLENTVSGKPSGDYADVVMAVGEGDGDAERKLQDKEL